MQNVHQIVKVFVIFSSFIISGISIFRCNHTIIGNAVAFCVCALPFSFTLSEQKKRIFIHSKYLSYFVVVLYLRTFLCLFFLRIRYFWCMVGCINDFADFAYIHEFSVYSVSIEFRRVYFLFWSHFVASPTLHLAHSFEKESINLRAMYERRHTRTKNERKNFCV